MILKFNQTNFLKSEIIAKLKKLNLKLSRQTEENFEYISFLSINSRSMNYSLNLKGIKQFDIKKHANQGNNHSIEYQKS